MKCLRRKRSGSNPPKIKVGIFVAENAEACSPASYNAIQRHVEQHVGGCWDGVVVTLDTAALEQGESHGITVLILPGGEARQMKHAISARAHKTLIDWTKCQRIGLVGICAGAVVACQTQLVPGIRLVNDNRLGSTALSSMVELKLNNNEKTIPNSSHNNDDDEVLLSNTIQNHQECLGAAGSWKIPYVSGPMFALKESSCEDTTTKAFILATYKTDVACEMSLRQSLMNSNNAADDPVKKMTRTNVAKKHTTSWTCSICTKLHNDDNKKKKTKTCCGRKKREHEKQWKLLGQLVGIMPGKGAIAAVESPTSRAVLFGPHPELGDDDCVDFLLDCLEWVSQPRIIDSARGYIDACGVEITGLY